MAAHIILPPRVGVLCSACGCVNALFIEHQGLIILDLGPALLVIRYRVTDVLISGAHA